MADDWILDVLADLKSYSARNGLPALEAQLGDIVLIAAAEIASKNTGEPDAGRHAGQSGWHHRAAGRGGNA